MENIEIKTANNSILLDKNPLKVVGFFLPDSTNVCLNGEQTFYIRTPKAVSEPVLLTKVKNIFPENNAISFDVLDRTEKFKVSLNISSEIRGIKFKIKAEAPEPIWLIEWKLTSLNLKQILVPALGGQSLSSDMPEGTLLSYKYPFWLNAQFVIGEASKGGLMIRSEDANPELKLLRVFRNKNSFDITYGFEAPGPLNSKTLEAEWYLDSYKNDWKEAVDNHRIWLEKEFKLKPFYEHNHFPGWANDINFVLELWGARRDREHAAHTFDQMIERINHFAKLHSPKQTLLYLPGFAENGVDSHAPDYNPSEQCGGEEKFKQLIDEAHRLGYHVMIHTNVLAMTFGHPLYEEFKQHQVIDIFGREQCWGMDMDGDWLAEPYFAYINPAADEWGELMQKVIGNLIEKFNLDAVFLDQTLLAFNVSRGGNFLTGMKNHVEKLQKKFSGVLFSGEGLHELNLPVLPMAQIHGIDSIAEVHGMDGQVSWKKAHPVSVYLFEKYTRYTAHLLTKHPSHPMFALQENAYAELGVIPALSIYNYEQELDIPETHIMIERSKSLNLSRVGK